MSRDKFFDSVFFEICLKVMPEITLFRVITIAENYFSFEMLPIIKNLVLYVRTKCIEFIFFIFFSFVAIW